MTQLESAKKGIITPEMEEVARFEGIPASTIREKVCEGRIIIPKNHKRKFKVRGIGEGLRTKINANIGTSPLHVSLEEELEKLRTAVRYGADSVMDLSTGGDVQAIREEIIAHSPLMVGTVPIYDLAIAKTKGKKITSKDFIETIVRHAEAGVDFITIHSAITRKSLESLNRSGRIMGIVSRGGAFMASYMEKEDTENPFYALFDEILDIARSSDVTLSIGDGLRPGALSDATDEAQLLETIIAGELVIRARERGVQVMVEGPGHVPLNQIAMNVTLEKRLCHGAPFYVLGPLTTDVAPGYDHITSAIGGAVAAWAGADFLCYVTPAEHLRLPTAEDVRMGVVAARIAAHSGDIAKGIAGAIEEDKAFSLFRRRLNWDEMIKNAMDPDRAREYRGEIAEEEKDFCSMCGEFCSIKIDKEREKIPLL